MDANEELLGLQALGEGCLQKKAVHDLVQYSAKVKQTFNFIVINN